MSANIYLAGLYLDIRKDITASVSPLSSLEKENVEDAEKMEETETEERLVQKFIKDDHKDDSHNTVIQVDRNIKEQKSNEPSNAKYREVNEPPETARSLTDTERGNKDNERRLDNILQPRVEEGPEWTTKIKTFKLTKVKHYNLIIELSPVS